MQLLAFLMRLLIPVYVGTLNMNLPPAAVSLAKRRETTSQDPPQKFQKVGLPAPGAQDLRTAKAHMRIGM